MWDLVINNKTLIISSILLLIIISFIFFQWQDSRKIRFKIARIEKHVQSIEKTQHYLNKLCKKSSEQKKNTQLHTNQLSKPNVKPKQQQSRPSLIKPKTRVIDDCSIILEPSFIFTKSNTKNVDDDTPKIKEITDSDDDSLDDDITPFDESVLDLELEKELSELN